MVSLRILERGEGPTRIGFAVGKRLDKRAVIRNRIRRRLRDVLRRLELREGYDVVVLARRPALTEAASALREDVAAVCRRAELLAEEVPA